MADGDGDGRETVEYDEQGGAWAWRGTWVRLAPSTRVGSALMETVSRWSGRRRRQRKVVWQAREARPCFVCGSTIAPGERFTKWDYMDPDSLEYDAEGRLVGGTVERGEWQDGVDVGWHGGGAWTCGRCRPFEITPKRGPVLTPEDAAAALARRRERRKAAEARMWARIQAMEDESDRPGRADPDFPDRDAWWREQEAEHRR